MSLIQDIQTIYAEAEAEILRKVAKRIERGIDYEGWAEKKSQEINLVRQEVTESLPRELKTPDEVLKSYKNGFNSAEADFGLKRTILDQIKAPISIQKLVLELQEKLVMGDYRILRSALDGYRNIIAETSTQVLTGVKTRREVAQTALNKFADSGITEFVDKVGRKWSMGTYTEMATRTVVKRAQNQGHFDRQLELGRDLIIISSHWGSCPFCQPWEGKVLSISGNDTRYPSLQTATDAGLFHPNCAHTPSGYIERLTEIPKPQRREGLYEATQEQRYNERNIRKYKNRANVALTEEDRQKSLSRVRQWQSKQRDLIADTGLKRKYYREKV